MDSYSGGLLSAHPHRYNHEGTKVFETPVAEAGHCCEGGMGEQNFIPGMSEAQSIYAGHYLPWQHPHIQDPIQVMSETELQPLEKVRKNKARSAQVITHKPYCIMVSLIEGF